MTLKAKFISSIALSIIVPSLLISIFSYLAVRKDMLSKEGHRLQNISREALIKIETLMEAREREMELFAKMGTITSSFEYDVFDQADELLSELTTNLPIYHQIQLLNTQHMVVASSDAAGKGLTLPLETGKESGVSAGKPYYDTEDQKFLINLRQAVFLDNKVVGHLLAEYELADIFKALDAIKVVEEGQIEAGHLMVFDRAGMVFYSPPFEREGRQNLLTENLKEAGLSAVDLALSGKTGFLSEKGEHGEAVVAGYDFYNGKLITLGAFTLHQTDAILSEVNRLFKGVGLLVFMLILVGIALAALVGTRSAQPVNFAVTGLSAGAAKIFSAAAQVAAASQSLADSSAEQAAAIEQTSASMEEMSSMTRQNAENANQANDLMKKAITVIKSADLSMNEMSSSMEEISQASAATSKIIKTIDEIAFQTNLLALNAAVEAARAGEAGAGFAVVADEVRSLAMRAAAAAKDTSQLIEGTVQKVNLGKEIVGKANEAFKEVAASSAKVDSLVGEITAASREQAQGFAQINQATTQMDSTTQQNSAMAEQSSAAAEELNSQAEEMMAMIQGLKLVVDGGTTSGSAQQPSSAWRGKLLP